MFTFGADPEFMLKRNGKYCSAIGVVPGDKDNRYQMGSHQCFYDNVMAECAICPSGSKREAIKNFRDCFRRYASIVAPHQLVPQAAQLYPSTAFAHKSALEVNCDPETDAYILAKIRVDEDDFVNDRLRTAGGHVHLGTKFLAGKKNHYNQLAVVRMLDLFLGIPSIFIDHDKTTKRRKAFYGHAGRYRAPKHGLEYRSLSNFWLNSPALVSLVYDICKFTIEFVEKEKHLQFWKIDIKRLRSDEAWESPDFDPTSCHICHGYDADSLRKAINTMDRKQAAPFMEVVEKILPKRLYAAIEAEMHPQPYDFYAEWGIG